MKKTFITLLLLLAMMGMSAQDISYIETTRSWYYLYDQTGKRTKGLPTSIGELRGFSASFFVVKNGSWYYLYDAKGNRIKGLSTSSVGEVLSVAGDTFTSRLGSWIYTWSKDGKKLHARPASGKHS